MRFPLRIGDFAELPVNELVQHKEFLNGGDSRGFIPFSLATMKAKIASGSFPQPVVVSAGGAASLWRAGDIQRWKVAFDRDRLKGAAA